MRKVKQTRVIIQSYMSISSHICYKINKKNYNSESLIINEPYDNEAVLDKYHDN